MTARERARLMRIAKSNAREYARSRQQATLCVIRGEGVTEETRRVLTFHAQAVAEAMALLVGTEWP